MQLNHITLSRRLYTGARAWYLRRLDRSLKKQRTTVEKKLMAAAGEAQANAKRHRHDPALQERRRFLRADHQVICDRQQIVSRELRELGVAA